MIKASLGRRALLGAFGVLVLSGGGARALAAAASPVATIEDFYATLLATMKDGPRLGFAGRRDRLAPAMARAFDLALMTRLTVGAQWASLKPADQTALITSFTAFSIANYANRFADYSGERFTVAPQPSPVPGGDVIVHTKLIPSGDTPVELDYRLRQGAGGWRVIDVYLKGTVSELATRRSEFTSVLRRGGASALVALLKQKTAELSG